jgi:uncharacterized membrane protein
MAKKNNNLIGSWAFLIGVVLALIFGALGSVNTTLTYVLVIAGLVVGLLNIADKEASPFLLSGAVLIIASALGQGVVSQVRYFPEILDALLLLFVPATIVVAIRHVFSVARR